MVLRNEDGQLQYNDFEIAKSYDFNLYGFTFYGLAELRMDKSLLVVSVRQEADSAKNSVDRFILF